MVSIMSCAQKWFYPDFHQSRQCCEGYLIYLDSQAGAFDMQPPLKIPWLSPPQLQGKGPQPNKNRLIVLDKFPQGVDHRPMQGPMPAPMGPEVKTCWPTECCDPKQNQLLIM